MTTKIYNVGIYCRLSNDDERDGESVVSRTGNSCFRTMYSSGAGMRLIPISTMGIYVRILTVLGSND